MFQMQAFPVCHSGLRIPTAVTQVDAEAWFQSLAWECLYATGGGKTKTKEKQAGAWQMFSELLSKLMNGLVLETTLWGCLVLSSSQMSRVGVKLRSIPSLCVRIHSHTSMEEAE